MTEELQSGIGDFRVDKDRIQQSRRPDHQAHEQEMQRQELQPVTLLSLR